jgi:cobaltochelatase CobS
MDAPTRTADALIVAYTKTQLVEMARKHGFKGDPERFSFAGKTGKAAIAHWIADQTKPQQGELMDTEETQQQQQQPTKQAAPKVNPDAAQQLAELLAQLTQPQAQPVDEAQVRAIVQAELNNQQPRVIRIEGIAQGQVEGQQHPLFEKVLRLTAAGLNVMLTGAAGAGKTHLAESVAKALNREYGAINCTAGASESQLMGWLLPGNGGKFEYRPAPFVSLYERGNSLFLFDEIDAADPNFLLVANSALANGHIHVPQRIEQPSVKRGENVAIMATANTYGTGADMVYAGRNQLDGATLDRWYIVHVDYMEQLEASFMGLTKEAPQQWKPASLDEDAIAKDLVELHAWLRVVRQKANENRLRRVVSTRAFIKAATARRAGVPVAEIKADLLAGWTADELRKVEG